MTKTIKITKELLSKMTDYYQDKVVSKPQYTHFQAKDHDTTITVYESLKVVFQGKNAEEEAHLWEGFSGCMKTETKKCTSKPQKQVNNDHLYHTSSIGSDEVGTGDYFGPVVVCATFVKKEDIHYLEELGIRDSKKVNDEKILKIAPLIMGRIPYSVLILDNIKYNLVHDKGMNQNQIKAKLHNSVIKNILSKIDSEYEYIIVDQFAEPRNYFNYLNTEKEIVKDIYFTTKAEDVHLSVASASIIARYTFLKSMDHLSELVGVTLPKGAGTKVDDKIREIVKKQGVDLLEKIAKVHFSNTQRGTK